ADRRLGDLGLDIDLDRLLLCYGDHLGDPVLREAVAAQGSGLAPGDVLVTPGAAAALFCVATAILDPGDHLVVIRTNYATNLETPGPSTPSAGPSPPAPPCASCCWPRIRGARSLVRGQRPLLPAGLRLALPGGAARRPGRADGDRPGHPDGRLIPGRYQG
ncbi:MAG: hypothetical protein ACRDND_35145, partial [Streptosporangiaceae bacterium]